MMRLTRNTSLEDHEIDAAVGVRSPADSSRESAASSCSLLLQKLMEQTKRRGKTADPSYLHAKSPSSTPFPLFLSTLSLGSRGSRLSREAQARVFTSHFLWERVFSFHLLTMCSIASDPRAAIFWKLIICRSCHSSLHLQRKENVKQETNEQISFATGKGHMHLRQRLRERRRLQAK